MPAPATTHRVRDPWAEGPPTGVDSLALPEDFPLEPYMSIRARMCGLRADLDAARVESLRQFHAAWTGVAVRYLAFTECAEAFAAAYAEGGRHPGLVELARQEQALFGLLCNGVASIESVAYGLFAIASTLDPTAFPLRTPTDRRNAMLGGTLRCFAAAFPQETVTARLFWWCNSREFGWWKEARAVVSQRLAPGRDPRPEQLLGVGADEWRLRGERIDGEMPAEKRAWLAEALRDLLERTDAFTTSRLASPPDRA